MALILASTSIYRQAMLDRLGLPYSIEPPLTDETRRSGETPCALARRLALTKAQSVGMRHPDDLVIGADQVLNLNGHPLGKPGSEEAAKRQLAALSGQRVVFHSAVALVSPQHTRVSVVDCVAKFRLLTPSQIEYYVHNEAVTDTAGSAKAEGLGIALLEELSSSDPTAIIGLPLIELSRLLRYENLDPIKKGATT